MSLLSQFPIKQLTFVTAHETAKEESMSHREMFIYLFRSNSGGYVIDYLGVPKSDEKVIATYHKGEKVL